MIARIEGTLQEVREGRVYLVCGDFTYEVLVPQSDWPSYGTRVGQRLALHTMYYFEGPPGGGNMIPRLIGFQSERDKRFFERLTTVQGIGLRKGLRSLAAPVDHIATAIEQGDALALMQLPEVGKATAQKIIAELKGKLGEFVAAAKAAAGPPALQFQKEAADVLMQLGERREVVEDLIQRAMHVAPETNSAQKLIQLVYRLKSGHGG